MTQASRQEVTGLLRAWTDGDQAALEKQMPLVYAELHRLAKRYMSREQAGHTLQTSALVNRYFGGLNEEEIAEALKVSTADRAK